jgi:hypothetical protein
MGLCQSARVHLHLLVIPRLAPEEDWLHTPAACVFQVYNMQQLTLQPAD